MRLTRSNEKGAKETLSDKKVRSRAEGPAEVVERCAVIDCATEGVAGMSETVDFAGRPRRWRRLALRSRVVRDGVLL